MLIKNTWNDLSVSLNYWYYVAIIGTIWFGLVTLFNGISTLFRLFNAKAILLEEQ